MNLTRNAYIQLLFIATLLTLLAASDQAQAIPAFTRQFKTECSTCHTIFPALTEQGENFMKNSFVWIDPNKPPETAEQKAAKVDKTEYLTLSSLPDHVPVSLVGTLNLAYNDVATAGNKSDFSTRSLVLDVGGNLGEKLGFWAKYNVYTEGAYDPDNANVPGNIQPNLVEMFFSAHQVFGTPINIKAGRMIPELSLWKGSNKTTISTPATLSYKVGRSQFFIDSPTDGIELNAILGGRLFLAAGAAKRKNTDNLEGFGSFSLKFGGASYEGIEKQVNLDAEENFMDYFIFSLGGYGYAGSNQQGALRANNDFYRWGIDADLHYKRAELRLASAVGRDDNPFFTAADSKVDSKVMTAEALYLIGSTVIPSVRFEYEDAGQAVIRRVIPAISYIPLQNAKLILEYKRQEGGGARNINVTTLAAVVSF